MLRGPATPVPDTERLRLRMRPPGLPLMRQRWRQLGFLHWSVDPLALTPLLPPGLELDLWDGKAYVGIVPFAVRGTRPPFLPPVPGLADFEELNLRTYVHRRGRSPGVYFFSLDATSRLTVWGGRALYRLPYHPAAIAMASNDGGTISFRSRRAVPAARPRFACDYTPVGTTTAAAVGSLELFLAERYLLYSWDGRRLRSARVWHHPYPLSTAVAQVDTNELGDAASLALEGPPLAHYSEGVDVRIYPPTLVREPATPPVLEAAEAPLLAELTAG